MVDQKFLDKAEVLIEALPYIQRFNRKIIVVKYGGSAMKDEDLMMHVIEDVVLLKLVGFKPVVVHGGGKAISKWVSKVGIEPEFYNGLRVTDADTLEVAEMVLGKVNKDLVSLAQSLGIKAVGISGKDGKLLTVSKEMPDGTDIGYVGKVRNVDTKLIMDLLEADFLPIIYPIGTDSNGQSYNVNADTAAGAIAAALRADKLAYLSDIPGVYGSADLGGDVVSELYIDDARKMIADGIISGGMIPKVENCIESIENGVNRVHILDGRQPHSLLLEIFTDRGIGTAIMSNSEKRYYKG